MTQPLEGKRDWYFTFGASQQYDGFYVIVRDTTFGDARAKMFNCYGYEWSGQYSAQQFNHLGLNGKMKLLDEI